ncbi:Hypothetical protein, putative [Bodo saltans]|uniref:Uncharacterized protein n=1 Tax=Bodo saltans TaxID=75058 RepID=A0A0S4KDP3_BODSA|nr:Hypothetical protein, putative [Bodo saltans]|eukprot:CUI10906.1 Hypothetical protein, putative [Bodo saltans]
MAPKRSRSATAEAAAEAEKPLTRKPPVAKADAPASAADGSCPNQDLIDVFESLLVYESKDGNKWAGVAYRKVVNVLRGLKTKVTSGKDIAHLDGVGDASVKKTTEFLTTGTIKKLDELKALHGALPVGMVSPSKSGGATTGKAAKAIAAEAGASPPTKAQLKAIKDAAETYESQSLQSLKDLCKLNKQVMSGTKSELVQRCAEGKVLGQTPICPFCGGGKLRYEIKTGMYRCPGYTDDDSYKPCVFLSGTVVRTAWLEGA